MISPVVSTNLFVPIGQATFMIPLYLLDKKFAVSFLNAIFGALLCALFYLFCTSFFKKKTSLTLTLGLGVSTLLWPYSKSLFNNIEEAFFVFLAFFLTARYLKKPSLWILLCILLSALSAFFIRMSGIIPCFIFFVFVLITSSKNYRIILGAGMGVTLAILISWNWVFYHHIFGIFKHISMVSLLNLSFFKEAFPTPFAQGLFGLLLSPGKGFFIYTPLACLGVLGFFTFHRRDRQLFYLTLALLGAYVLFYSKLRFWPGDFAWGPRYLVVLTPYFIFPIGYLFEQRRKFIKPIFLILLGLGFLIQIPAIVTSTTNLYYHYLLKEKTPRDFHLTPFSFEVYSKPRLSPIFLGWKTTFEIASRMKTYAYQPLPNDFYARFAKVMRESLQEEDYAPFLKEDPVFNTFDLWWIRKWITHTSPREHTRTFILRLLLFLFSMLLISGCGLALSSIAEEKKMP
ncbi:MAG: hypothetical protein HYW85_03450 [Deltaproteobacteria bacterium]|nr:hypothetical protein [Deltaproteobacteria bacterium]